MKKMNRSLNNIKTYLFFAGPATFIFFTVIIIPFIYGVYLTTTNWDGIRNSKDFVGFSNYLYVLKDQKFWDSLAVTIQYVFFSVLIINVIAFALAYFLTNGLKAQNFFRAGFFIPNLIGGITLGYVWRFIFSTAIPTMGQKLGISFLSVSMLGNAVGAKWAMVFATVWQYAGYMMVIYIAGLMMIPKELIEASSIDGANFFHKIKSVTLPLMTSSFVICTFLSLQRAFMVYDVNLALTDGGPYGTTRMLSMHVYNEAFTSSRYGSGQAEAIFLFIIVAAIALTQVYFSQKLEVEA